MKHKSMVADFKRRFWIVTIATIPILFLAPFVQKILSIKIVFPGSRLFFLILTSFVYVYGGWPFLKGSFQEFKNKAIGMMTLVAIAITVAHVYSFFVFIRVVSGKTFFWEVATLIDVMLFGHWLEMKSLISSGSAVKKLASFLPKKVKLVLHEDEIKEVSIKKLKKDDIVLVKPGAKIPVDGIVEKGSSVINQAALTGESKPVSKKEGDKVIGGSINGDGSLYIKVERIGEKTYLSRIVDWVEKAQKSKSNIQTMANKAAFALTIIAIVSGVVTFAVWFLISLREPAFALERMISVMVIACPHALGLAIPLVITKITALASGHSIFIKSRKAFEQLRKSSIVVFDKTGTLTTGTLKVTNSITFSDWTKEEILQKAASVEKFSEHHVAQAIVDAAQRQEISLLETEGFKAFFGVGVKGTVEGEDVFVCSVYAFNENNNKLKEIPLNDIADIKLKVGELEKKGNTVLLVATKDGVKGAIVLSSQVRKEAKKACADLKNQGFEVAMITGDTEVVAKKIAKQIGIKTFFANVLPTKKAALIKKMQKKGDIIAMVGDGVNDAPALAQADVGIAIGSGTDIARETADIILVNDDLMQVVNVIRLSKTMMKKTIQNLAWATGYNVIAMPLAAGVLYNQGIVFSPAVGALIMSMSTIIVAFNSRLIKF